MKVFELDDNQKVILSPELRLIKEFRLLIEEDKDRFKKQAIKWFQYIYFMYSYKSQYADLPEVHRKELVEGETGVTKINPIMQDAIDKFILLQATPTLRTLTEVKNTLDTTSEMLKILRKQIESNMTSPALSADDIGDLVKRLTETINLANTIPKTVESIEKLEDKVKKEKGGDDKLRGGRAKGHFEDEE